jgi:hypothetical protein
MRRAAASIAVLLTLAALLTPLGCRRGVPPSAPEAAEELPLAGLSPRYRQLLRQEMVQIEGASMRLLSHLARGEAALAASTAAAVRDTFLLRRNLSAAELAELVAQLPPGFLERDGRFHQTAGALAAAAGSGDLGQAVRLYGELVEGCAGCHSRFAAGRFPGFTGAVGEELPAATADPGSPAPDHHH